MESEKLKGWISEELADCKKYTEAYKETECGIYHDIAHEELRHAHFLCEIYKSKGGDTNAFKSAFEAAEKEYHSVR